MSFDIYLDIYLYYPNKIVFLFIITILNRLFFYFVITLDNNNIGDEGAKALAEGLKLNKNLISINLGKFLRLFKHITVI